MFVAACFWEQFLVSHFAFAFVIVFVFVFVFVFVLVFVYVLFHIGPAMPAAGRFGFLKYLPWSSRFKFAVWSIDDDDDDFRDTTCG